MDIDFSQLKKWFFVDHFRMNIVKPHNVAFLVAVFVFVNKMISFLIFSIYTLTASSIHLHTLDCVHRMKNYYFTFYGRCIIM